MAVFKSEVCSWFATAACALHVSHLRMCCNLIPAGAVLLLLLLAAACCCLLLLAAFAACC